MKRIIYLAFFLAIVSAVAGGLLGFVYEGTYEQIEENKLASEKVNLIAIFPDAEFKQIEYTDEENIVEKVFEAGNDRYVYKMNIFGYQGVNTFMIGFDANNTIVGYSVITFNDTPGFGDKIMQEDFINQVIGTEFDQNIDTISGATVSSTAIVNAIDHAKKVHAEITGTKYNEANDIPEFKPDVTLDKPVKLNSEEVSRYQGEIKNITVENNVTSYHILVDGYGIMDSYHPENYERNEVEVKISNGEVVSVEFIVFSDTLGIGDFALNQSFYDTFSGLSIHDLNQEVDSVNGATYTSRSLMSAVAIAMQDASNLGGQDE